MNDRPPTLFWFRRDLRLRDHPGLAAAREAAAGPVIPVFILDPETEAIGAAPRWRLGLSVADLRRRLRDAGSDLVLRRGPTLETLKALAEETGARAVHWSRLYSPDAIARDRTVKAGLTEADIKACSHPGHVLHEPWRIETSAGASYKVYTPYWRAVRQLDVAEPGGPVSKLPAPADWPASDDVEDWDLAAPMHRGADVVGRYVCVGEDAAADRLETFLDGPVETYARDRDRPDLAATSHLSENLTYGEISAATVWHAARAADERGADGAETFLQEIVWRDFAWHLIYHTPRIVENNWRPEWDDFPWREDNADAERWRRGLTGETMIDAGMREMYVTGRMHNRVRMLVASYLTKHLMTHWKVGLDWFADCLIDWDPASNALGWQWAAGSGPDATPYFRIFNPATQAEKFDPDGAYRHRFLRGFGPGQPHGDADAFFEAMPRSWDLDASTPYPKTLIDLKKGRETALEAYRRFSEARKAAG